MLGPWPPLSPSAPLALRRRCRVARGFVGPAPDPSLRFARAPGPRAASALSAGRPRPSLRGRRSPRRPPLRGRVVGSGAAFDPPPLASLAPPRARGAWAPPRPGRASLVALPLLRARLCAPLAPAGPPLPPGALGPFSLVAMAPRWAHAGPRFGPSGLALAPPAGGRAGLRFAPGPLFTAPAPGVFWFFLSSRGGPRGVSRGLFPLCRKRHGVFLGL